MKPNSSVDAIAFQDLTVEETEMVRGGMSLIADCMIIAALGGLTGLPGALAAIYAAYNRGCFKT